MSTREQVVAANVDVVFIVASLTEDLKHASSSATSRSPGRAARDRFLLDEGRSRTATQMPSPRRSRDRRRPRARGLGPHRARTRRRPRIPRLRDRRRAARPVRRREVDARQHARRRGSTCDRRDRAPTARARHTTTRRELVPLPGGGLSWTTRVCASSTSGSPTRASRRLRGHRRARSRSADSRTAGTRASRAAPCAPPSPTDDSLPSAGESYRELQSELAELDERLERRERSRARRKTARRGRLVARLR